MKHQSIINVGVIAHVDAGKSTLVDALLQQTGVFNEHDVLIEQVMDNNDLERERGITIYSKNCAIKYKDTKINIVDTPGHADFSSEVERILKTVDTVILLVDSSEGPMPQTRVVLEKALRNGLRPILFINKIDKKDARSQEVVDLSFDLFVELKATDEQLDFPIVYGVARDGIAKTELEEESNDLTPLLDLLLEHVTPYPDTSSEPFQMQISSLAYDDYLGRMGIGRITRGTLKTGMHISRIKTDGTLSQEKVGTIFINQGLSKIKVTEAFAGDMITFSGLSTISIGETLCDTNHIEVLPHLDIERPTLSMLFLVNNSPFASRSGKFVTTRQIHDRLQKELETNVGLEVEPLTETEGYKVSGRGELHLSILLEKMRREGFELSVSKPEVLYKHIDGALYEPFEKVFITVKEDYLGQIITQINLRKGTLSSMLAEGNYVKMSYSIPSRGLIGYRSEFINTTHGEGTIEKVFDQYMPYAGDIPQNRNGVFIAKDAGTTMAYSLFNLSERGTLFVNPSVEVYAGMIVGLNSRDNDLVVNPCKNKHLTNTRSSGADEAIKLLSPKTFTLEEALEFIADDELVEITPAAIRLRKKELSEKDRKRSNKQLLSE